MEKVRVSKLMSQQGLCSRREADTYIERGWVLVDGVPVTELGTRAFPNQKITLAKAAQSRQDATVTILLHKPMGYVSAQPEKGYKPAIVLVTPEGLNFRLGATTSVADMAGAPARRHARIASELMSASTTKARSRRTGGKRDISL